MRDLALIALAGQLVLLAYNPSSQIPTAADRRGGDVLLAELRSLRGTVLLTGHGYYLTRTGHPTVAQGAALSDVLRAPKVRGHDELAGELREAIDQEQFDYVIVDSSPQFSYLPSDFEQHYRMVRRLSPQARPVTGTLTAPASIWVAIGGHP